MLIKPQFEAGKEQISKGGVVRSAQIHSQVVQHLLEQASRLGLHAHALNFSPVKGPAGNIEFLVHWKTHETSATIDVSSIIDDAHRQLSSL